MVTACRAWRVPAEPGAASDLQAGACSMPFPLAGDCIMPVAQPPHPHHLQRLVRPGASRLVHVASVIPHTHTHSPLTPTQLHTLPTLSVNR
eukprot:351875-Chlamydomonas_euryale.AAC.5